MRRSPPPLSPAGLPTWRGTAGASSHTPPPFSPSGLPTSRDTAGASTHAPPPAAGDSSTVHPLPREDSETSYPDFEIAWTRLGNYLQAMSDGNFRITDPGVEKRLVALIGKVYQGLPPDQQEQLRAKLKAIFPQHHDREENGTRKQKIVRWIKETMVEIKREMVPLICVPILIQIVKWCWAYFSS